MKPGDLVAANVRLERLLSEGGMGSVWVADHLTLHTQVAVKFMSHAMAKNPEAMARFEREASAAAQIKSPHVVQIFDHGLTPEGTPYIVMDLLQGEDLASRLDRGPLAVGETLQLVRQLCKALSRAHQLGIVHRDIKPGNLFLVDVEGDIFVKVLDFGIAKRAEDNGRVSNMTQSGTVMGTPKFMSPEQITSTKDTDFQADLWAAGVVAYLCLTGEVPFSGDTVGAIAIAVNAGTFTPVTVLAPGLPPAIDGWFARALARKPEDRFASAKEMGDALLDVVPREMRTMRPPAAAASVEDHAAELTPDVVPDVTAVVAPISLGRTELPVIPTDGAAATPASSAGATPTPSGSSREPRSTVDTASTEAQRAEAQKVGAYGRAPTQWWRAPGYAYRVRKRQVELRKELVARTAAQEKAQADADEARVALAEVAWPFISRNEAYAELVGAVTAAETVLHERDGALAAETEALAARTAAVDRLEAELAEAVSREAALTDLHASAEATAQRAEAKLKRALIELRNASAGGGEGPATEAEVPPSRGPEVLARQAEFDHAKPAVAEAAQKLEGARRALAPLRDAVRDAKNAHAAMADQIRRRQAGRGAEASKAQRAVRDAMAAVGHAADADRANLGTEFDAARGRIADLERITEARGKEVMLYVMAFDAYDRHAARTGRAIAVATAGIALAGLVAAIVLPLLVAREPAPAVHSPALPARTAPQ